MPFLPVNFLYSLRPGAFLWRILMNTGVILASFFFYPKDRLHFFSGKDFFLVLSALTKSHTTSSKKKKNIPHHNCEYPRSILWVGMLWFFFFSLIFYFLFVVTGRLAESQSINPTKKKLNINPSIGRKLIIHKKQPPTHTRKN